VYTNARRGWLMYLRCQCRPQAGVSTRDTFTIPKNGAGGGCIDPTVELRAKAAEPQRHHLVLGFSTVHSAARASMRSAS
jgi:hypothetical protein